MTSNHAPEFEIPKVSGRVLVVEARFYGELLDELAAGAIEALTESGVSFDRIAVPGALEIPAAIELARQAGEADPAQKYDAFVALGCVIRGATGHYDIVANESSRGLMELSVRHGLAIGNGILTVENDSQAWERANRHEMNKGAGAAVAALRLLELRRQFGL